MHTVARASSPSPMQHTYHSYHHHASPAAYTATQSLSTPGEPLSQSYPFSQPPMSSSSNPSTPGYSSPRVEPAPSTPARGCLKAPTKEFTVTPDAYRDPTPTPPPSKNGASASRRRPNMKLERLPSSAIARIQLAEGVEHPATGSAGSTPSGKCKTRVPTPYVKSDKGAWLSENDE
ncbi:dihydroxyacetone kinase [Ceratobasidium sp. AG-Ba]|nr:dihydroxyacetone kinase [Ceratobasidium sp. AG-Ba]